MNTKKSNFQSNRKYLVALSIVMALNLILGGFLIHNVLAQKEENDFKDQKPVKAEVMDQKDNPLRIMVASVDNSPLAYQEILFSMQNNSNKPIKAYTLLVDGKRSGKVVTGFFTAKKFPTGESVIKNLDIERSNITEGETILISVDYVEFEDGSSWGSDSTGNSKLLAGQREGTKSAITQLKNLSRNQNVNSVINFLNQDLQGITVDIPNMDQSDEWKRGFRLGYKSVISILQEIKEEKVEKVFEKLNEMEKIANQGGKQ